MTSEIRANTIKNRVGLGTVSFTNTGAIVSGIVTATGADINGDLDVDGHTNLDNVSVAGVTTTSGLLDINAGGRANTFKVEDLTNNRVVIGGIGGELEDSANLTFDGSKLILAANSTAYDAFQIGNGLFIGNTTNNVNAAIFHQGGGADLEIGSQNAITFTTGSTAGNATEKVRITSAGRVGIGSAVPDGLLTIQGNSDATTTPSIRLKDGTDTREVSISNSAGDFVVSTHGTDNVQHGFIKLFESGLFTVATGGTGERLRIDTNGRLSLGVQASPGSYPTATVARQVQAEFKGSIDTSNNKHDGSLALNCTNNNANLHIIRSQNNQTSGVTLGNVNFTGFDGTDYHVAAQITGARDAAGGNNDMPGRLVFLTTADGASSPTERLRIDSTGRVLVNTTTTNNGNNKMIIAGPSPSGTYAAYDGQLALQSSETSGAINTGSALVFFGHDGGNQRGSGAIRCLKENGTSGNHNFYMSFLTRVNGGSNTEKLRIESDGELRTLSENGNNSDTPGITFRGGNSTQKANFARIHSRMVSNWGGQLQFKVKDDNGGLADAYQTAMIMDHNGIVTKPLHPAFNVKGGNMTRTNSDNFVVAFNNDSASGCFDNGNNFNTTTHKFVAPVSGHYHFAANVRLDGWDSGYIRMAILSTSYHAGLSYWSYPSTGHIIKGRSAGGNRPYETFATSTTMYLPATHEAWVYMSVQNETSFTVYLGESSFNGHLIG